MIRQNGNLRIMFEKVPDCSEKSIVMDFPGGELSQSWYHYHPEPELTLILRGSGRALLGATWIPFRAGDLTLIGENVPHIYVPQARTETRCLKFHRNFLTNGILQLPEFSRIKQLFEEAQGGILFQNDTGYGDEFRRFENLSGIEQLLQVCLLLARLSRTPHHALTGSQAARVVFRNDEEIQMTQAIHYLQHHFHEKVLLPEVAAVVGMEAESFRRFFSRRLRMTFSEYLLELRLFSAQKQLQETTRSILEIAQRSGFQNLSNFNRLFLKRYHMTPREYRKL